MRFAWPGTSLTTQSMDSLVSKTLNVAGQAQITYKTVIPATNIIMVLLTRIQDHVDG